MTGSGAVGAARDEYETGDAERGSDLGGGVEEAGGAAEVGLGDRGGAQRRRRDRGDPDPEPGQDAPDDDRRAGAGRRQSGSGHAGPGGDERDAADHKR